MRSSFGYALLESFCHLFKQSANEPAPFPTDVNNLLARFVGLLVLGLRGDRKSPPIIPFILWGPGVAEETLYS
jgi:hypothetical protein